MSYHHINTFERGKIESYHELGYSSRKIGTFLNRHHSTVARELKRVCGQYSSKQAHDDYFIKRKNSKPRGKATTLLCSSIAQKLKMTWSPEQIANTCAKGLASFKTIYNWLYSGKLGNLSPEALRRKGRKRSCRNLGFFASGTSIRKRPKEVYGRKTFGHWELDTIVSGKGKGCCLASFIERKRRFYLAASLPDRTAASMQSAIKCLYSKLPQKAFLTATTDRGGEFACFKEIEKDLGISLYFADPYCAHQRGSNEYGNGLLREFFPKKTDFAMVFQAGLSAALLLINLRPRKCLGWQSPLSAFIYELSHLD